MYASTKHRNLPPVPRPATKPVRDPRFYSSGGKTYMIKIAPADPFDSSPRKAATANRQKEARRKHEIVRRMALEGRSDKEIQEATGYAYKTVRALVTRMIKDGLPKRKGGRKKIEKSD